MSKRNKLLKFEQNAFFHNVVECPDPTRLELFSEHQVIPNLKGQWHERFFSNSNPIVLELACGRGEYTLGMARSHSNKNFIGVDVKGARIWQGAKTALENQLGNVGFLRTRIEVIQHFFEKSEISEIWITFPDPFARKERRRLVYSQFLDQYKSILKNDGLLHLKTDDTDYYEYALESITQHNDFEILYQNEDIYASPRILPVLDIQTYYERQHLSNGKTIKYIQSQLKNKEDSLKTDGQ